MRAVTAMMLFSFGRSKKRADASEQSKSGFMDSIRESVHGARSEGGSIILWRDIGGGTYPARPIGHWIREETGTGSFRLVYQHTKAVGTTVGEPLVSVNEVSRAVALAVCIRQDLSGMLSVYTPDRDDARRFMADILGYEPVEYGFSVGFLNANIPNFRRRPWEGEEGLPGPVCFFGDYIGDQDSLRLPENRDLNSDFVWGYHPDGDGRLILSRDLGGRELDIVDASDDNLIGIERGSFRLIVEVARIPQFEGDGCPIALSVEDISRDDALAICSDRVRQGGLGVYTPDRDDARVLMSEANRGRRPNESRDVPSLMGMSCFTYRDKDDMRPRAVFGRPHAEGV